MTIFQAIILGIIQGITEFLPISSSGHLVIVPFLFGWEFPAELIFPFDVLIQISTLIAVIAYYWSDLKQIGITMFKGIVSKKPFDEIEARTGWLAILATIPAGIIGLLFKDQIENVFSRPDIASILLIVTAILIIFSEKFGKKSRKIADLNWFDAIVMGISQAFAIFPGVSRSGSTISGGLARNLDRKTAGQFAFLMAIPIMAAAGLLSLFDLIKIPNLTEFLPTMIIGFVTSGVVGFFSIRWLLKYISNHSLIPFAIYCLILGSGSSLLSVTGINNFSKNEISSVKDSYQVTYSSSIEWIKPQLVECSNKFSETVFLLGQVDEPSSLQESDIHFSYDELSSKLNFSYLLGTDSLVVGVNSGSGITQLSLDNLQNIYRGNIASVSELQRECEQCVDLNIDQNTDLPMRLWGYSENSFFETSIQNNFKLKYFSPEMLVAPNSSLMKQAVLIENSAIGIFPMDNLDGQIIIIPIIDEPIDKFNLQIIASSQVQPDPYFEGFIKCVQEKMNN
jgi:undecaprenyl-diphosphatase